MTDTRFLCTFSLAHTLYLTQSSFLTEGSIELTNLTRPFWSDILNDPALLEYIPDTDCLANKASDRPSMAWWKPWSPGTDPSAHGVCGNTWQAGSKEFNRAIKRLGEVGDAFMNVGRRYATEEGRMSEQIDRYVRIACSGCHYTMLPPLVCSCLISDSQCCPVTPSRRHQRCA